MLFYVCVTCFSVEERVLLPEEKEEGTGGSEALRTLATIVKTTLHLPRKIRAVCWITFWSWIGWSPFFVYGATWAGETYYRQSPSAQKELQNSTDAPWHSFFFSFISLAGSIILPWIVESPDSDDDTSTPAKEVPEAVGWAMILIRMYRIDITTAWDMSQLGFATSMILAPFSQCFQFATTLIALCGLPWAMYGWVPLALMGEEINKLESSSSSSSSSPSSPTTTHGRTPGARSLYTRITSTDSVEMHRNAPYNAINELSSPRSPHLTTTEFATNEEQGGGTAGVYLGIWNIFATIPQFIATFISMIIFSILEPGLSPELADGGGGKGKAPGNEFLKPGLSGTAVLLAIGAICSSVATSQSFRLRKM
ncbi:MAG: hypothetical protein MMC33_005900 [Icmadophila ericetorum]|nr:hypothetical protein [Icmadophila ericetorum]